MLKPREILIDRHTIERRVKEMAREIESRHEKDEDLIFVCVLKGAVIFASDLMRSLTVPLIVDFVAAESYGESTASSGVVKITRDVEVDVRGKKILVVEDIVDTGLTLKYLINHLKGKNPKSLEVAVLLDKASRRVAPVEVQYRGFEIPDAFVVGCGLDYAGRYRNLPDITIVKEEDE